MNNTKRNYLTNKLPRIYQPAKKWYACGILAKRKLEWGNQVATKYNMMPLLKHFINTEDSSQKFLRFTFQQGYRLPDDGNKEQIHRDQNGMIVTIPDFYRQFPQLHQMDKSFMRKLFRPQQLLQIALIVTTGDEDFGDDLIEAKEFVKELFGYECGSEMKIKKHRRGKGYDLLSLIQERINEINPKQLNYIHHSTYIHLLQQREKQGKGNPYDELKDIQLLCIDKKIRTQPKNVLIKKGSFGKQGKEKTKQQKIIILKKYAQILHQILFMAYSPKMEEQPKQTERSKRNSSRSIDVEQPESANFGFNHVINVPSNANTHHSVDINQNLNQPMNMENVPLNMASPVINDCFRDLRQTKQSCFSEQSVQIVIPKDDQCQSTNQTDKQLSFEWEDGCSVFERHKIYYQLQKNPYGFLDISEYFLSEKDNSTE